MEGLWEFFQSNWFEAVQTVSIVSGLLFTGIALRRENTGRNLSNLLAIKQEHRELWNTIYQRPELARVLQGDVDLLSHPMTGAEEVFLRQVIVHVAVSWDLVRKGMPLDRNCFKADVTQFFSLPLPKAAWKVVRGSQKEEFVNFVEKSASGRAQGFLGF